MAECQPSKLAMWVRFPSPAPTFSAESVACFGHCPKESRRLLESGRVEVLSRFGAGVHEKSEVGGSVGASGAAGPPAPAAFFCPVFPPASSGRSGRASIAPATSKRRGSVWVFIVKSIEACRMAAWAVRGATPALFRWVRSAMRRACTSIVRPLSSVFRQRPALAAAVAAFIGLRQAGRRIRRQWVGLRAPVGEGYKGSPMGVAHPRPWLQAAITLATGVAALRRQHVRQEKDRLFADDFCEAALHGFLIFLVYDRVYDAGRVRVDSAPSPPAWSREPRVGVRVRARTKASPVPSQ